MKIKLKPIKQMTMENVPENIPAITEQGIVMFRRGDNSFYPNGSIHGNAKMVVTHIYDEKTDSYLPVKQESRTLPTNGHWYRSVKDPLVLYSFLFIYGDKHCQVLDLAGSILHARIDRLSEDVYVTGPALELELSHEAE